MADWSYFFFAELLFFVLFVLFFVWQYWSLKKDKAVLKAQRQAQADVDTSGKVSIGDTASASAKGAASEKVSDRATAS